MGIPAIMLKLIIEGLKDSGKGLKQLYLLTKASEDLPSKENAREEKSALARRREERLGRAIKPPQKKGNTKQWLVMCMLWNGGLFIVSLFIFDFVLLPGINYTISYVLNSAIIDFIATMTATLFNAFWVIPLYILSKMVNSFWFQDIANEAYRHSHRKVRQLSLSKMLSDTAFGVVLQIFFLMQGSLFYYLPAWILGPFIYQFHVCLLYAMYSFEYTWCNMGWDVRKRMLHIEMYWPYFIGFGLPLTLVTSVFNSVFANGAIFSMLFPIFVVSASEANEVTNVWRWRLPIFVLVTVLTDWFFQQTVRFTQLRKAANKVPHSYEPTPIQSSASTSQESLSLSTSSM